MKRKFLILLLISAFQLFSFSAFSQMLGPQTLNVTGPTLVTTGSTIAAGARSVEFIFSSDFAGTINGVAFSGSTDTAKTFDPIGEHVYPAITYTISAGSARLTVVR